MAENERAQNGDHVGHHAPTKVDAADLGADVAAAWSNGEHAGGGSPAGIVPDAPD